MKTTHVIAALSLLLIGVAVGVAMFMTSADRLEPFEQGGKWGFKNNVTGTVVIDAKYDDLRGFHEGLAAVSIGGKWGYIDKEGVYVVEPAFDDAAGHYEGRAQIRINGKCGFVNRQGQMVIKPIYAATGRFGHGMAPVKVDEKWGYIDRDGKLVFEPQFEFAGPFFDNGYATFGSNGKRGLIDKQGRIIFEPKYDAILKIGKNNIVVLLDERIATFDYEGRQLTEWTFQEQ